jgi:Tfp pilus assembly protein PilF
MQLNKTILEKRIDKANRYLDDQKNAKAEKFLKKLLENDDKNDEVLLLLGITKRRLGKLKEAIEFFRKAVQINPSREEAWGLLTITLIDQGNVEMAEKAIEEASSLNPENARIQLLRHTLIPTYIKHGPFF